MNENNLRADSMDVRVDVTDQALRPTVQECGQRLAVSLGAAGVAVHRSARLLSGRLTDTAHIRSDWAWSEWR